LVFDSKRKQVFVFDSNRTTDFIRFEQTLVKFSMFVSKLTYLTCILVYIYHYSNGGVNP
jgi:hypothetical protein